VPPELAHISAWIFDLDNTLYPASSNLFQQVDARMTAYVARITGLPHDEARALQKRYFHHHGTTVAGLMAEHGVDAHHFLDEVHDIEMDVLEANAPLAAVIAKLPGRKLVFTNGDAPYATRVLDRLGLGASFEAVHDIHAMALVPKPAASAYASLCERWSIDPAHALFADDMARNLPPAKAIGMTTVWVDNGSEQGPGEARDGIDYTITDVTAWLHELLGESA
jgi:putative hydrolase of the HAD superfamily